MDLERAREIVHACIGHVYHAMGIQEETPPSLENYSLREMIEANEIIRATADGMHCDDRLVAALYAASHYQAQGVQDCEPICVVGDRALFVLSMKEIEANRAEMVRREFPLS